VAVRATGASGFPPSFRFHCGPAGGDCPDAAEPHSCSCPFASPDAAVPASASCSTTSTLQDKLARVGTDGVVTTIASGAPFDFPASVAYRGSELYVTNFALFTASSGKPTAPGLLKLRK
jgi:hypothetical protein